MSVAQDRTLWIRDLRETARGLLPDGTLVTVMNEYRRWGPFDKKLEESGCPKCKLELFDGLTRIYFGRAEDHEIIVHINSGRSTPYHAVPSRAVRLREEPPGR